MGMLHLKGYSEHSWKSFYHMSNNFLISHRNLCNALPEKKGMDHLNNTYYPLESHNATSSKLWYMLDAQGQTLGRLATLAAVTIRGKTGPRYHPAMEMGNYVVVINAEKVVVTG